MSVFLPISPVVYLLGLVFAVGVVVAERMWRPLKPEVSGITPITNA